MIYLDILILYHIFLYIFSQNCLSKSENNSYLGTVIYSWTSMLIDRIILWFVLITFASELERTDACKYCSEMTQLLSFFFLDRANSLKGKPLPQEKSYLLVPASWKHKRWRTTWRCLRARRRVLMRTRVLFSSLQNTKSFQDFPSHHICQYMYGVLNIGKN
jgi:hypothetical protein